MCVSPFFLYHMTFANHEAGNGSKQQYVFIKCALDVKLAIHLTPPFILLIKRVKSLHSIVYSRQTDMQSANRH